MAAEQLRILIRQLRRSVNPRGEDALSDALLLERWTKQRDEAAFEVLLWRHGPMVLAVCRRLLSGSHDIEDAFQATFLTLVRKGGSIRRPAAVAAWLHRIASRIALRLRGVAALRARREQPGVETVTVQDTDEAAARDLRAVLDKEIDALPERYRWALLLCDVQGKTHAEAARLLGRPPGTVSCWLKRGRERLRGRLLRRGIAPAAAFTAVGESQVRGAMSGVLVESTCRAAKILVAGGEGVGVAISARVSMLVEETLKGVVLAKLKLGMVLALAVGVTVAGVGVLAHQAAAPEQPPPNQEAKAPASEQPRPPEERPARTDRFGDPLPPGAQARLGTVRLRREGGQITHPVISPDGKVLAAVNDGRGVNLWSMSSGKLLWRSRENYGGPLIFSPNGKQLAASACLLDPATGQLLRRIPAKNGYVLAFSADSTRVVTSSDTGSDAGAISVWETESGRRVLHLKGHGQKMVIDAAFTPDGHALIALDWGKKLRHWDAGTGELRKTVDVKIPHWHTLQLSRDGRALAVAPDREPVRLYDVETGKLRCLLQGDPAAANYGLAFSPDGRTLVTNWTNNGWWDKQTTLSLWDTSTGKPLRRFLVPAGEADNLCLAADGRTLATGGQGAALHLWDSVTGKPVLTWPAHSRRINDLSFTPDGRCLVSYDRQTLRLWEVSSARHLKELSQERPSYFCNFAITPDGRSVLSGGHTLLRLQELPAGEERQRFLLDEHPEKLPKPVGQLTGHLAEHIGLSTDGRVAACVSTASSVHEAHVWDLATGRLLVHREIGSQIQLLGITPDATATIEQRDTRTVPSGVSLSVKDLANLTQLVLRDLRTGRHLLTLSLPDLFRSSVCAVSPDGRTLVTATTSATQGEKKILWGPSTIRFWELASGKERMAIACGGGWEESRFKKFAFAPDGRTMATVGDDRSLRLWDAVTGNELLRRTGFPSQATALTFAPGGTSLATGHADSTILIWDIAAPKRASERPDRELKAKDLERCWSALAGDDAPAAWRAVWEMAAAARQVVPLLRQRLRPVAAATDEELRPLLADLDSTEFARRKAASARLAKLGERAVPALENVLKAAPSPEKRRRIEGLLPTSQIVRSPEVLSHVRAIEVLEHVGTIEAQQVLKTLVQGMPQSRITREAKASLERLTARRPAEKR